MLLNDVKMLCVNLFVLFKIALVMDSKRIWSHSQIKILIETWRDHLGDLCGRKINNLIYQKIATTVSELSKTQVTSQEAKSKMQNLTKQYW